jgi:hypothetical protein
MERSRCRVGWCEFSAEGIALLAATRDTDGFGDVEVLHLRGLDEAAAELLTARLNVAPAAEVVAL